MARSPSTTSSEPARHALPALLALCLAGCSPSVQPGGQLLTQIEGARSPAWSADARLVYVLPNEGGVELIADDLRGYAQPVAQGERWFVNWADVPAASVDADARLWFSFLPIVAEGTYDYAAWIGTQPRAMGHPMRIHTDEGAGEHGFVSIAGAGSGVAWTVWLDGRAHKQAGGATRVYARRFDAVQGAGAELLVDERACDCCPTSLARWGEGSIVAYRDRSESEVRDITVSYVPDQGEPRALTTFQDGWEFRGCPVNGPAVIVQGRQIRVLRYTEAGGSARVILAGSSSLDQPWSSVEVARGNVLGRVDMSAGPGGETSLLWLEKSADAAVWRLRRMARGEVADFEIAAVPAGRESGRARVLDLGTRVLVAVPGAAGIEVRELSFPH